MAEPSSGTLLEWLKENTDLTSLEELSLATGVELPSLYKINNGDALPSIHHIKAIRRIYPRLPLELMKRHVIHTPEYISTRRGVLPDNTVLHVGRVKELRPGDLIPYLPIRSGSETVSGSHWVEVRSITSLTPLSSTVDFGGLSAHYVHDVSIRFARKADSV